MCCNSAGNGTNKNCWHYEAIDKKAKINCPNCVHWSGDRCKDEATLLAEWDRKYKHYEFMMRDNKGVSIDS